MNNQPDHKESRRWSVAVKAVSDGGDPHDKPGVSLCIYIYVVAMKFRVRVLLLLLLLLCTTGKCDVCYRILTGLDQRFTTPERKPTHTHTPYSFDGLFRRRLHSGTELCIDGLNKTPA